ncbi:MAG: hypothetical protein OXG02_04400 [Chloroflexi bacterium]|nr:hypothetical protein [Anaerolineaceae bacterium]MCY4105926.1 hypothetical protein [Chloroflexota bacterium]
MDATEKRASDERKAAREDGAAQDGAGLKRARFEQRPFHYKPLPRDHRYWKEAEEALERIWARLDKMERVPTVEEDDAALARTKDKINRELFGRQDDPEADE